MALTLADEFIDDAPPTTHSRTRTTASRSRFAAAISYKQYQPKPIINAVLTACWACSGLALALVLTWMGGPAAHLRRVNAPWASPCWAIPAVSGQKESVRFSPVGSAQTA